MAFACALACGLSKLGPQVEGRHDPDGIVWWNAFHDHSAGLKPYVGVMMTDGILIEGRLTGFTTDDAAGTGRDLALASPIRITPKGTNAPIKQRMDRIIIPERLTCYITVHYLEVPVA